MRDSKYLVSQTNAAFQSQKPLIQLCSVTLQIVNLSSRHSSDLSCYAFLASLMPPFLGSFLPQVSDQEPTSSDANHTFLQQGYTFSQAQAREFSFVSFLCDSGYTSVNLPARLWSHLIPECLWKCEAKKTPRAKEKNEYN